MAPPIPPPRELTYLALSQVLDDGTFQLRAAGDVSSLAQSIAQAGQLFPVECRRAGERFQLVTGFRRLCALRLLHRDRVLARVHEELPDETAAMIAAADAIDTRPLEPEELDELRDRYRSRGWSTPALEELLARAREKSLDRRDDLLARLAGRPAPDRSVPDEDGGEDEAPAPLPGGREAAAVLAAMAPAQERPADSETAAVVREAEAALAAARAEVNELDAEVARVVAAAGGDRAPHGADGAGAAVEVTVEELAQDLAGRLSEISLDLSSLVDEWGDVPEALRGIIADQLQYYSELGAYLEQGARRRSGGEP